MAENSDILVASMPKRSGVRAVRWRRMMFGLALAGAAGTLLGEAWTSQEGSWWWLGLTTLFSASLMVFSATYVRTDPKVQLSPAGAGQAAQQQRLEERWEIEPMLGEILVQHGVITSDELLLALERQDGTGLLLGEVLIDMHLIPLEQLEAALSEQSAWRDARRYSQAQKRQAFRIVANSEEPQLRV